MISQITGTLVTKDLDRVEILTAGGLAYEAQIPLSVFETLPKAGETAHLHTSLVVKEDAWQLFGFASPFERRVFDTLRSATGVGPALALSLLSSLTANRVVRAILEKDIATLQGVPRVGRKKAEHLILDLADKMKALHPDTDDSVQRPAGATADDAIRALVSLGYNSTDAERATRAALDSVGGGVSTPELIRAALVKVAERR